MQIQTGYLYHINEKFFEIVKDKGLMLNHEKGRLRP